MESKMFHIGDILSVTTGRVLSERNINGVCDLLNFMTGQNLCTYEILQVSPICRIYLSEQFPHFAKKEMVGPLAELDHEMRSKTDNDDAMRILKGWLARQVAKHGKMLLVKSLK